jgi:predicted GTPase
MGRRVIIMGAAGRDFHVFNTVYRDDPQYDVVAFTANQIPGIEGRKYPRELSGKYYPDGICIFPEGQLKELIQKFNVDEVVFAYSDVTHEYVMHKASEVLAAGADYRLFGPKSTMLKSSKPVISICAVRTGAGKSPTTRTIAQYLKRLGFRTVIIRHPMPYGILKRQVLQRFEKLEDLEKNEATIEEREEYEPHIKNGFVVFAGVDYEKVLRAAEDEADIILWDGGNNDFSFMESDLYITIADAYRPGHELTYHPGEMNFRLADVIIINKIDRVSAKNVAQILADAKVANPKAEVVRTRLRATIDEPYAIRGKRVLAIEDGPTVTHGGMKFGAAYIVAKKHGVKELVNPRKYAVGTVMETYARYPHLQEVLPAIGYSGKQIKDLQDTINNIDCDAVVSVTPTDLSSVLVIKKPFYQVCYEVESIGKPTIEDVVHKFLLSKKLIRKSG